MLSSMISRSLTTSSSRVAQRALLLRQPLLLRRGASSKASLVEADAGGFATHVHHAMTVGLALLTPLYFILPESSANSAVGTTAGLAWSGTVTAHSWIGLNYVCTDYVPKVSKALLGPARYVNVGIAIVTFLGLGKMCLAPGGIKGVLLALWRPKKKEDPLKDF